MTLDEELREGYSMALLAGASVRPGLFIEAATRIAELEGQAERDEAAMVIYQEQASEQADRIAELEAEIAELRVDRRALVNTIYARDGIVTQDAVLGLDDGDGTA